MTVSEIFLTYVFAGGFYKLQYLCDRFSVGVFLFVLFLPGETKRQMTRIILVFTFIKLHKKIKKTVWIKAFFAFVPNFSFSPTRPSEPSLS